MQNVIAALRGGLLQQDRLLKLDTPLGANTLTVQRAVGRSRIGRAYEFTLDVLAADGDVELKKLIAQPVTLWIQQADRDYQPMHGYVHTARRLGADGELTTYQLVFADFTHFLKFRRDQRIWSDAPVDQIISDVLNRHPQARGRFRFALSTPLPSRSYTRQHETDWHFVHRLMEDEGLYCAWQQADDGQSHTLVITDNLQAFAPLSPETVHFYRAGTASETDAFTQWSGTRTLQSVTRTTRTFDYKNPSVPSNPKGTTLPTMGTQGELPDQLEVYEYTGAYTYLDQSRGDHLTKVRMEAWESEAKRFRAAGGVRGIDAGRRFTLSDHPEHDRDPADQREFAVIEVAWWIENNLPVSSGSASFPHSLSEALMQAQAGCAADPAFHVPHGDGSVGFYLVEVEAQRASIPYRSPFEHHKPVMHLETAIVVGPQGEEVYTDELNRIRVQFVWDRVNPGNENASCWVRVVQSDTGGGYGGVHIPRIGEEVLIDYVGGDCDRPLAVGRVYNGAAKPQWHSDGILSGYRSKEYSGGGYNQLVMDDATGQNRVQLMSSSANSLLHLGYLIDQNGNTRGSYLGSGFDLRSDAHGAVRASQGLYVTTHPKAPNSQPLDVKEAQQQLVNAESLVEALSGVSEQHQAESLKDAHDTLRAFTDATQDSVPGSASGGRTAGGGAGNANAFKEPVMLFGSPSGIGMSTQQSVHVAANDHVNIASGRSVHVAAGKSLLASIGQKLSLFVQNAGIKLFAGKGKVEIQAQSDSIEVTAQKTVKVLSATDKIEIAADQGILLTSGGGYIRIAGGNIEIHAPGKVDVKGASHAFSGPASMGYPLPSPRPDQPGQLELLHKYVNGEAVKGGLFTVRDVNGAVLKKGALDGNGYTVVSGLPPGAVRVEFGKDPRESDQPANYFKEQKWPVEPVEPSPEAAQAAATGQLASQLQGIAPAAASAAMGLVSGGAGAALGGLASAALPAAASALGGAGVASALQTATRLSGAAKQVAGMVQAARQGGLAALAAPVANAALKGALPGIAGKGGPMVASTAGTAAGGMKLPTSGFGGPLKS
ncbi:Rhs element Vgr protein [Burkholderia ubonensis]|uniref:Rhs element Vgr protein n=3 Tax=Burkholderia ubonensis TaxID=101571 RepID=A0AB73G211_9BURK|nr:type VI secretion system Vgr family protein [Burkholderia ubonensis]KVK85086.1 Rhs element Vgr protein [Burkholderia ubonensis]KVL60981.1 Rhs element Vgr protein [Burkholderia ubonensis]KVM34135.1 Rhs element Vgr protein [Burkholderia ubonensis]KVM43291.1 Rhs element Vgr protein [Burkholderia ubonensis]